MMLKRDEEYSSGYINFSSKIFGKNKKGEEQLIQS